MSLAAQLEAILFVAGKPLTARELSRALAVEGAAVEQTLAALAVAYDSRRGIVLARGVDGWQFLSNPEWRAITENFVRRELLGELTRPQLEALTVISYCGPISKPELEQIRGVNCSIIVRNLLLRGLIQEGAAADSILSTYEVTVEYLRQVGVRRVEELPDYAELHSHPYVTAVRSAIVAAEADV